MIVVLLISFAETGCEHPQAAIAPVSQKTQPYQRFVSTPVEHSNVTGIPWSGAIALDSKTGQLCYTYSVKEPWNGLPLCFDLYKEFPD